MPWANMSVGAGVQLKAAVTLVNTTIGVKMSRQRLISEVKFYTVAGFNKKVSEQNIV